MAVFPTAKDIYIEVDGRRLAAAQSYRVKTTREARSWRASVRLSPPVP